MLLYHASRTENRDSILKHGLNINRNKSGYGKPPVYNAVYLFSNNNKTVIEDLMLIWGEFDIYEVHVENLDISKFVADEDSGCDNWIDSLCLRGTVAYLEDIGKSSIQYGRRIEYNEQCSYAY